MKHTKRLARVLLALTMAAALAVPALAAGFTPSQSCTVTFGSPAVRAQAAVYAAPSDQLESFEGYQLLSLDARLKKSDCHEGTVDDPHVSSCYRYAYDFDTKGENGTSKYRKILMKAAELENDAYTNNGAARDALLAYLGGMSEDATRTFADAVYRAIRAEKLTPDAKTTYPSLNVEQGYWLFADVTTYPEGTEGTVKSLVLLDTAGNPSVNVAPKRDVPKVEKKISDTAGGPYGDSADVNIGDSVYFKITGTLPAYLSSYVTYKYEFHDTLSDGLTLDAESIQVTVDGTDVTNQFTKPDQNQQSGSFTVSCEDVKDLTGVNVTAGSEIVLTYSAVLNTKAVTGNPGNPNRVHLEYSNDPYGEGTGRTPEDIAVAFTFELDVTKVDTEGKTIEDTAEFKLSNADGSKWLMIDEDSKVAGWADSEADGSVLKTTGGQFRIIGLDQGIYYLKETKAPGGYNLLKDPVKVEIKATYNETSKQPAVKELTVTVNDGEPVKGDPTSGAVAITVKNSTGIELPSTGGAGTRAFYALGTVLVLGAGILLVNRKRMGAEE